VILSDSVIIITGAAGGIGSAIAELAAVNGANTILTDVDEERLAEHGEALQRITEKEIMWCRHDVTSEESWEYLIQTVQNRFDHLDILVNNAGVVGPGAADDISDDTVQEQVAVNLLGTIYGCRAALRVMKQQNSGKIINIASLGGIVPMSGEAVYCATKAAIRGYSHSLYAELIDTPIGVTVVCPDSVDTPLLAQELLHDGSVMSFLGRPLTTQRVAKRVLKAAGTTKPEILIPAGTGIVARIGMAVPALFFLVFPVLRRIGSRNIQRRRKQGIEPDGLA